MKKNKVKKEKIKTFVQETLGCNCPEEVFESIDYRSSISLNDVVLRNKMYIGNRLLIFVFEMNENDSFEETLIFLVDEGLKERDRIGFNRFRLVVATDNPGIFKKRVRNMFDRLEKDERMHVHVVHKDELQKLGTGS